VSLKEEIDSQFPILSTPDSAERVFPLCFETGPEEKTLLLGTVPRAQAAPEVQATKREKQQ
jgi:hypothetical protein